MASLSYTADSQALLGDLIERASIAFQDCLLAAQFLPPLDDHINMLLIKLDAVADAFSQLRSGEGGATAQEGLVD